MVKDGVLGGVNNTKDSLNKTYGNILTTVEAL